MSGFEHLILARRRGWHDGFAWGLFAGIIIGGGIVVTIAVWIG